MRRLPAVLVTTTLVLTSASTLLEAETVHRSVPKGEADLAQRERNSPALPRHTRDAESFYVPYFEVDLTNPSGLTTLWAVRNNSILDAELEVQYRALDGRILAEESFDLPAKSTRTRNLRDVPGLIPAGDGIARGFVKIQERIGFLYLSGDFFYVDPAGNAARGGRLVDKVHGTCPSWTVRFFQGGAFSGGTRLTVFVKNPLGTDVNLDPPTFETRVYDEAGHFYGSVLTHTNQMSQQIDLYDLVGSLPNIPNFGSVEIKFHEDTDEGVILADYTAADRYSITVHGWCTNWAGR